MSVPVVKRQDILECEPQIPTNVVALGLPPYLKIKLME